MELSPLLSVFKKLDVVTAAPNVASRRTNSVDIRVLRRSQVWMYKLDINEVY